MNDSSSVAAFKESGESRGFHKVTTPQIPVANATVPFSSSKKTGVSTFSKKKSTAESWFSQNSSFSSSSKTTSEISLSLNPSRFRFDITQGLQLMGRFSIIVSNFLLVILLCNRWKESGHFPLSNLYESLMFLS